MQDIPEFVGRQIQVTLTDPQFTPLNYYESKAKVSELEIRLIQISEQIQSRRDSGVRLIQLIESLQNRLQDNTKILDKLHVTESELADALKDARAELSVYDSAAKLESLPDAA